MFLNKTKQKTKKITKKNGVTGDTFFKEKKKNLNNKMKPRLNFDKVLLCSKKNIERIMRNK
jgi:hypothetical protein